MLAKETCHHGLAACPGCGDGRGWFVSIAGGRLLGLIGHGSTIKRAPSSPIVRPSLSSLNEARWLVRETKLMLDAARARIEETRRAIARDARDMQQMRRDLADFLDAERHRKRTIDPA